MELTSNRQINAHPINYHFLTEASVTDREAYDFYRENRKKPSKLIDQYNYYIKAVDGIFRLLADVFPKTKGGVYIDGLGYFACIYEGKKRRNKFKKKRTSLLIKEKKKNKYVPYFFPDPDLENWTMDGAFHKEVIHNVDDKIEYTLNFGVGESVAQAQEVARKYSIYKYEPKKRNEFI